MSLQNLSEWLRCPNCFLPLNVGSGLSLSCDAGHSFDVNKRGYATMLPSARKFIGDSATMLDARDSFQAAGWYSPLERAVVRIIAAEQPRRILDAGCGTGYYLRGAVADVSGSVRGLGMDLSPAAVARTVRSSPHIDGLVADVWSALPVRDGAADVILNVFAPRNPAEFERILRPGGLLLVVVPQQAHLQELRAAGLALNIQADKAAHLEASLGAHFTLEAREPLSEVLSLSDEHVAALIAMGPSAHHTAPQGTETVRSGRHSVTAAFDVFSFRRRSTTQG